jgi:hypothetical protein
MRNGLVPNCKTDHPAMPCEGIGMAGEMAHDSCTEV